MALEPGYNSKLYIRAYKRQASGLPHASFPASPPAIGTMVDVSEEGFNQWNPRVTRPAEETGGKSPAVPRSLSEVVDITQLNFSVLYTDVTSPDDEFETDAALLNHGMCNNWLFWLVYHPHGTKMGEPQEAYPVQIESCVMLRNGQADQWRFNVTCRGWDAPVETVQT